MKSMKSMKLFSAILVLLYITQLSAQTESVTQNEMKTMLNSNFGMSTYFVNPKRRIEGTVYLFDKWENKAVIHATNQQKVLLHNINLNIERNTFESKVGRDSLYAFSFINIEKFIINNRVFKNYYWDNDNRVYELIAEGKNVEILMGFSVDLVEGSPNPQLNRMNDKFVKREKYFAKKDDKITAVSLRKSRILNLLDLDEQQQGKVINYIEEHKLSFKKDEDLKIIFEFVNKLI